MKRLFYIALINGLISCSKENSDTFYPYGTDPVIDTTWSVTPSATAQVARLDTLFAPRPYVDSFNLNQVANLRFPQNLEIMIPPNTCRLENGNIAAGKAIIEVRYLRTRADMIRFARPTTSFNRLLESAGAVHIRVTRENRELFVDTFSRYRIRFRENNPINKMRVFYGQQSGNVLAGVNNDFTWIPAPDSSGVSIFQDSSGISRGYEMFTQRFSWINCDYFLDSSVARTRINAIVPSNFTNNNTTVYAVFKDQKVVLRLSADAPGKTFYAPSLPVGKNINIVSISSIGGILYYDNVETTVSAGLVSRLSPRQKTQMEINQLLDLL